MKILTTARTGTPEWLAARKGKIGGNMAADILGYGRNTIVNAWAELTGKIDPPDISKLPQVRRGNLLEPVILQGFQEDSGYSLLPTPGLIQHDVHEFLAGTPDALYRRPDGVGGVVDAKSVGFYKVADWAAGIPLHVQIQVAFYALLLGPGCDLIAAAAMPVDEDEDAEPILWDEMAVNDVVLSRMEEKLVEFWERHVIPDIPPEFDPVADRHVIKAMFPRDVGTTMTGSEELRAKWLRIQEINKVIGDASELSKEKERLRAEIELEMGDNTWATCGDFRLQYRSERREEHMVKAWEGRQLRKVKA